MDEEWVMGSTFTQPPSGDVWSCWWPLTPSTKDIESESERQMWYRARLSSVLLYLIQIHIKSAFWMLGDLEHATEPFQTSIF